MNPVPDLITHVSEIGAREMESTSGAGFWSVCHGYNWSENDVHWRDSVVIRRIYLLNVDSSHWTDDGKQCQLVDHSHFIKLTWPPFYGWELMTNVTTNGTVFHFESNNKTTSFATPTSWKVINCHILRHIITEIFLAAKMTLAGHLRPYMKTTLRFK